MIFGLQNLKFNIKLFCEIDFKSVICETSKRKYVLKFSEV